MLKNKIPTHDPNQPDEALMALPPAEREAEIQRRLAEQASLVQMARAGSFTKSDSGPAARPAPKEGPARHEPPQASVPEAREAQPPLNAPMATIREQASRADAEAGEVRDAQTTAFRREYASLVREVRRRWKAEKEALDFHAKPGNGLAGLAAYPTSVPEKYAIRAERLLTEQRQRVDGLAGLIREGEAILTESGDPRTERNEHDNYLPGQPARSTRFNQWHFQAQAALAGQSGFDEHVAMIGRDLRAWVDSKVDVVLAERSQERIKHTRGWRNNIPKTGPDRYPGQPESDSGPQTHATTDFDPFKFKA
jgi:hypothetical protein